MISDQNSSDIYSLLLLPVLLTSIQVNKTWKPSQIEVKNGFLLHAASMQEAHLKISARTEILSKHGYPVQPVPVIIGEIPNCQFYMVLNDIKYSFTSIKKAVDTVYRLLTFLDVGYPPDCRLPWLFLHKFVYKFNSDCDQTYIQLGTLAKDLNL